MSGYIIVVSSVEQHMPENKNAYLIINGIIHYPRIYAESSIPEEGDLLIQAGEDWYLNKSTRIVEPVGYEK
jgi:5'-3' exonuclease